MVDRIDSIGRRHGFGAAAVREVAEALRRGGGTMARFNHPELGGMGQWSAGGMVMIGDMFNHDLEARVAALCNELAGLAAVWPRSGETTTPERSDAWWPAALGRPSSSGAQNDMRYACFPDRHRLAVTRRGKVMVYDTGDHRISGFSQQQGSEQTLTFISQIGTVRLEDLRRVG